MLSGMLWLGGKLYHAAVAPVEAGARNVRVAYFLNAFEIDLEYGSFAPGFHLLAELSYGDLDPLTGSTFTGAHAWLAYRTGALSSRISAVDPVFRASHAKMNDDEVSPPIQGGTLLTPGINFYFGPLNRVMLNYDVWMGAGDSPDARSWKAMFQLGF